MVHKDGKDNIDIPWDVNRITPHLIKNVLLKPNFIEVSFNCCLHAKLSKQRKYNYLFF